MTGTKQAEIRGNKASQQKVLRFALSLWSCVAVIAVFAPWAYSAVAVLFATFLHFACLDGDEASAQTTAEKR